MKGLIVIFMIMCLIPIFIMCFNDAASIDDFGFDETSNSTMQDLTLTEKDIFSLLLDMHVKSR